MAKGGESLGNEESSEEEEEVILAMYHTPGVRLLAPGVVFPANFPFNQTRVIGAPMSARALTVRRGSTEVAAGL